MLARMMNPPSYPDLVTSFSPFEFSHLPTTYCRSINFKNARFICFWLIPLINRNAFNLPGSESEVSSILVDLDYMSAVYLVSPTRHRAISLIEEKLKRQ